MSMEALNLNSPRTILLLSFLVAGTAGVFAAWSRWGTHRSIHATVVLSALVTALGLELFLHQANSCGSCAGVWLGFALTVVGLAVLTGSASVAAWRWISTEDEPVAAMVVHTVKWSEVFRLVTVSAIMLTVVIILAVVVPAKYADLPQGIVIGLLVLSRWLPSRREKRSITEPRVQVPWWIYLMSGALGIVLGIAMSRALNSVVPHAPAYHSNAWFLTNIWCVVFLMNIFILTAAAILGGRSDTGNSPTDKPGDSYSQI